MTDNSPYWLVFQKLQDSLVKLKWPFTGFEDSFEKVVQEFNMGHLSVVN